MRGLTFSTSYSPSGGFASSSPPAFAPSPSASAPPASAPDGAPESPSDAAAGASAGASAAAPSSSGGWDMTGSSISIAAADSPSSAMVCF